MLTASNAASPEVVKQVREGFSNIEGVLQNTTNIPGGADIASIVKQNMQVGAAAAKRAAQIKSDVAAQRGPDDGLRGKTATPKTNTSSGIDLQIAQKHLEMFSSQANLSAEQQAQLNTQLLQLYAQIDKMSSE